MQSFYFGLFFRLYSKNSMRLTISQESLYFIKIPKFDNFEYWAFQTELKGFNFLHTNYCISKAI